ncbi:hypothetical protein PIB30_020016 [Stylosanthes scabra]|uniref:Uncharacterized protein n=1 Tax=Stylosanthes scabra TaxID=79078 RepID=A0ABU6R8N0_9FABA|nr:hypothetical protein [Stylosanthes scabra]
MGFLNYNERKSPPRAGASTTQVRVEKLILCVSLAYQLFGGGVSDPTDQLLNELLEPAITRPILSLNGAGVCDPTTEAERTLGTCCHQAHALIPVITVVNPCRRDLTLASRGVRIAVKDLTSFLPIRSYGGLAAKVICTFHLTAETLWDSTR